jgi:hypothetical protein
MFRSRKKESGHDHARCVTLTFIVASIATLAFGRGNLKELTVRSKADKTTFGAYDSPQRVALAVEPSIQNRSTKVSPPCGIIL